VFSDIRTTKAQYNHVPHTAVLHVRITFYSKSLNGRDHLEDTGLDGTTELKRSLKKEDMMDWNESMWLSIWNSASGGVLGTG